MRENEWRSTIVARWHFAPPVGRRHSKVANNGGHVADEPMAFCTNDLRIQQGPAHPMHTNHYHLLLALLARAKQKYFFLPRAIRFIVSLVGLRC